MTTDAYDFPDAAGHFGPYGGLFVSETLIGALTELREAYERYRHDPDFQAEFRDELEHFVGRPSPVYHARRWSQMLGGAQIYFKREDLNHTGAHKINNAIGQALLARRMGKKRIIAETGAGQHGVATATVAARYGLECTVYMGSIDAARQRQNIYRMNLLGAKVVEVESGSKTLKDALNEAMRVWVTNVDDTFYIIGTVAGPHPYPMMVRDFQAIIGQECRVQMPAYAGRQPDVGIAAVGGGSNRPACGLAAVRRAGCVARQPYLCAAGCRRAGHRDAFGVGRAGLPGCGSRTRLAEGFGTCRVRAHRRCPGAGSLPRLLPHRGHHSGAGIQSCAGRGGTTRAHHEQGRDHSGLPVGPGRQGHAYRGPACGPELGLRGMIRGAFHREGARSRRLFLSSARISFHLA